MAWICELTGKSRLKGNQVSHSNIKTRKFTMANVSRRKWHIPELSRSVTLTLSMAALRTIDHRGGLSSAILMEKENNLSDRLIELRRALEKQRRETAKAAQSKSSAPQAPAEPQDVV